jgi:beta-xylosidase
VKPAGNGLLKSATGKPEGPYVPAFTANEAVTRGDDPTLFQDTDGTVYYAWMNGHIRQLNKEMNGFVTEDRILKTSDGKTVGYEGMAMAKMGAWYVVAAAEWEGDVRYQGSYDLMYAVSKSIWGPYSQRRLAVPHAGHSAFFQDHAGRWYATLFGNDRTAPFRTAAGMVPLEVTDTGNDLIIRPARPDPPDHDGGRAP